MIDFIACSEGFTSLCHKRDYFVLIGFVLSAPMIFIKNLHFYSNISLISVTGIILLSKSPLPGTNS